ncbi:hypothetical protein [Halegenticoccus soli]|uniref:hypothetical protein n=1 Tax=Halegenticoccus soli TaxID=1985678 RepID=UPI00117AD817|nr:hypothetical protein [Halegenticoccus soli]
MTRRVLIENIGFGALGLLYARLVLSGTSASLAAVRDELSSVLLGALFAALLFSVLELSEFGTNVQNILRNSALVTASVIVGLLVVVVVPLVTHLADGIHVEAAVAWLIGFSSAMPVVSTLFYLR